jgi:mono/diheme cytochrome c family protein
LRPEENSRPRARVLLGALLALGAALLPGCRLDMHVQPRYNPLDPSKFFEDGRSARPAVPGTVARGQLRTNEPLYTGKVNGVLAESFPFPITRQVLERGRERYNIFCSPCHDYVGSGHGMIVQRGFQPPPSYHNDRLRKAPVGHYFDVITNGYGAMHSYAARVPPEDRWAIIAYIRALQLSQQATLEDVPDNERDQLLHGTGNGVDAPEGARGVGKTE